MGVGESRQVKNELWAGDEYLGLVQGESTNMN